ncbi:MAG: YgaP family membrane protein [Acidimicrobiales bacterium]
MESTSSSVENRHGQDLRPTHLHRPSVNITPVERTGRIAIGVATIVIGAILLTSATSGVAIILEVLLVAAGADLLVTGALGHCPLYAKLNHVPTSLRRPS